MKTSAAQSVSIGLAAVLFMAGCDNMSHQHDAKTTAARPPPAHTVARGQPMPVDGAEQITALPIPLTHALLERGRERFNIYCAPCHGEDGYGRGIVPRRGFPQPPSYHDERLRQAAVGHFYDVMTRGYGAMYSFADRLEPRDRWAIAAYIRALQLSQHAMLADVPPNQRDKLTSP